MSIEFSKMSGIGGAGNSFEKIHESKNNLLEGTKEVNESGETGGASFGDFLQNMVKEANSSQVIADQKLNEVAAGRNKDLHGAVMQMEKADVDFRLLTQVRNKVIEAYREIMRMQV
ncbi:MAG: flagellar hook-basal body complex protein FliE [Bdellovibrionota bacterium]